MHCWPRREEPRQLTVAELIEILQRMEPGLLVWTCCGPVRGVKREDFVTYDGEPRAIAQIENGP